jgi:hypothetical protein
VSSDARPVFVDDSGVRRVVVRVMWLLCLAGTVLLVLPGPLNLVMADARDVGATTAAPSGTPYSVSASAIALPSAVERGSGCTAVSGEVFIDRDLNGWRSLEGEAETAIAGIDVFAFDENGAVVATTSTADDGRYRLEMSQPRHVRVEFSSAMAAYIESPIGSWSHTATQFPVAPHCTANLGVMWRRSAAGPVDAAARRGVGQASGHVWMDTDCDGVLDPGEAGAQTEVELRDMTTRFRITRTPTSSGGFVFAGLQPGVEYEVVVPQVRSAAALTRLERSRMDGGLVTYSIGEQGGRASLVLEEQGQSRHDLRFPISPEGGCAPRASAD